MSSKAKELLVLRADQIPNEKTNWLWPGRLALGKLSLFAGHPGVGKSQVLSDLAARVSSGKEWPDGSPMAQSGSVLILNAEDDPADTIGPRLTAAGADKSMCYIFQAVRLQSDKERHLSLGEDIGLLENKISEMANLRMIIIDPITSYTGLIDSNNVGQVRNALDPLVALAKRSGAAILVVSHLNKKQEGPALQRVVGSISYGAIVRTGFVISKDDKDSNRRLFLTMKNNLAPDNIGLSFEIVNEVVDEGIETSRIQWNQQPFELSADQALSGAGERSSKLEEAKAFLVDVLAEGPVAQREIEEDARSQNISLVTINRAKKKAGVVSYKAVDGWWWRLSPVS